MAYTVKARIPCSDCGVLTRRRLRVSRIPCCVDCGIRRSIRYATELSERTGDTYIDHLALIAQRAAEKHTRALEAQRERLIQRGQLPDSN